VDAPAGGTAASPPAAVPIANRVAGELVMVPQSLSPGELIVLSFLIATSALAVVSLIGFTVAYLVTRERARVPAARPVKSQHAVPAGVPAQPVTAAATTTVAVG
jgi:hypothetical protein